MFCPDCGREIKEQNYCPRCGIDLRGFKAKINSNIQETTSGSGDRSASSLNKKDESFVKGKSGITEKVPSQREPNAVESSSQTQMTTQGMVSAPYPAQPAKSTVLGHEKYRLIVLVAVLLVLLVVVGAFMFISYEREQTSKSQLETTPPAPAVQPPPPVEQPQPALQNMSTTDVDEITNIVRKYADTQSQKDLSGYLDLYASQVEWYSKNIGKQELRNEIQPFFDRATDIKSNVTDIEVKMDSDSSAKAEFNEVWSYMHGLADGKDWCADTKVEQIYSKGNGRWAITSMRQISSKWEIKGDCSSVKLDQENNPPSAAINPVPENGQTQQNTQHPDEDAQIKAAITGYYKAVADKKVDDAIQYFSKDKIPNINRNLIESVATDTEYYEIEAININEASLDQATTTVYLYHKKYNETKEYWRINIKLVKENGAWKLWSNPGQKL